VSVSRGFPAGSRFDPLMPVLMLGITLVLASALPALGQTHAPQESSAALEAANGDLKTCLQRHYRADVDSTSDYRSGAGLIAACRTQWDQTTAVCVGPDRRTPQYCDAQNKMMLLGFVPMQ
jgi:hypothetical protein